MPVDNVLGWALRNSRICRCDGRIMLRRSRSASWNVMLPFIASLVSRATSCPLPQNFANSSIPSSRMTVESTSKQTTFEFLIISAASWGLFDLSTWEIWLQILNIFMCGVYTYLGHSSCLRLLYCCCCCFLLDDDEATGCCGTFRLHLKSISQQGWTRNYSIYVCVQWEQTNLFLYNKPDYYCWFVIVLIMRELGNKQVWISSCVSRPQVTYERISFRL